VVTFAYVTGWRIQSEVLKLTWSQVDFKAGVVRLEPGTTKSGEGRTFPFTAIPELCTVMEEQKRRTEAAQRKQGRIIAAVFHRNGEPVKTFYKAWRKATVAAGCPGRIPHDFRRTAVRNLVRAGVPEKTAMMMTGHKTRAVFDRYDIINEADLRAGAERLAESLAGTKRGQSASIGAGSSVG
jgi:integrase